MYKNVLHQYTLGKNLLVISCFLSDAASAQLTITRQPKIRGKLCDCYGTLKLIGINNAALISQRPRITFNYIEFDADTVYKFSNLPILIWGHPCSHQGDKPVWLTGK